MADDLKRWARVQRGSRNPQPFHAKPSPVSLHMDANRRRNLDKEEAARDRVIVRWTMMFLGLAALMGVLLFVALRLKGS